MSWCLVVPVKDLSVAKSRLAPLGEGLRSRLALAFAADVVTAALACEPVSRVLVVTSDAESAQLLGGLGAQVVRDVPEAGLNAALRHGASALRRGCAGRGVAALSADLPALRSRDLQDLLCEVGDDEQCFVADEEGTGTTLLAAGRGTTLDPRFGDGSRGRHLGAGFRELTATAGLRLDVDTPEDLERAVALGVGVHTRAVVADLGR